METKRVCGFNNAWQLLCVFRPFPEVITAISLSVSCKWFMNYLIDLWSHKVPFDSIQGDSWQWRRRRRRGLGRGERETRGDTYCSAVLCNGALTVQDIVDPASDPGLTRLRVNKGTVSYSHRRRDKVLSHHLSLQSPEQTWRMAWIKTVPD